jgi:hypothetical protein
MKDIDLLLSRLNRLRQRHAGIRPRGRSQSLRSRYRLSIRESPSEISPQPSKDPEIEQN